ncbi:NUDIX domain-containing protein [Pseudomonas sp. PDM16]|uniref:NUDIX hydrolase n=1 Tax=Pseudomonas sp. PDM16 TaxID=2769292 RepID=UPI00177F10D9|nr:NUDIX domain-containing protein [Pseudomonas sp. PDM16]MBD9416323.1 NUDIX domain-containing protein [Pseudomonas sp. PDM16]
MARLAKARATVICQQAGRVLLVRKAEAKWTLPGGKIEANEGPVEAALRELCEETGLASEALEYLALHQFDSRAHHVFRLSVPAALDARPLNEIADCRWFAPEDVDLSPVKRPSLKLLKLYCSVSDIGTASTNR